MIDLNKTQRELNENKDFKQYPEYKVVQPGLTNFHIDEIIKHEHLLIYLSKEINTLEDIELKPYFSI